jgi:hypothetical protein
VTKLTIGALDNEKPVTLTIKLSAELYRDLVAYADAIKRDSGHLGTLRCLFDRCLSDSWQPTARL